MPRARDFLWAIAVCVGLTLAFHYRPLWSARRFVQRESQEGFVEAYQGHRWIDGQLIGKSKGSKWDPAMTIVRARGLSFEAEDIAWSGNRAAFVVRHVVKLDDGSPSGHDVSSEVHVELERHHGRWEYTRFRVRGQEAMALPITDNPWARILTQSPAPFAGVSAQGG